MVGSGATWVLGRTCLRHSPAIPRPSLLGTSRMERMEKFTRIILLQGHPHPRSIAGIPPGVTGARLLRPSGNPTSLPLQELSARNRVEYWCTHNSRPGNAHGYTPNEQAPGARSECSSIPLPRRPQARSLSRNKGQAR